MGYLWDFENNVTDFGKITRYIYDEQDIYFLVLTFIDNSGKKNAVSTLVFIDLPVDVPEPTIRSRSSGGLPTINYKFILVSSDVNRDDIYDYIDWRDHIGFTEWIEPYSSDDPLIFRIII